MVEKEKEKTVKPFVLRMDAKTMSALEKWASDEFRSMNGQILYILHNALKHSKRI